MTALPKDSFSEFSPAMAEPHNVSLMASAAVATCWQHRITVSEESTQWM